IRGHGIPEAIEAILLGRSRLDVKVAILKPLSSAIAIGTGGPFGAEGPIIMTGGAIGSLIAQGLPVSDNERKTLLVAGAAAGMTTVFGTPIAAIMLAVELLLFEWTPRSFIPVAAAAIVADVERTAIGLPSPLFPFHGTVAITLGGLGCWILVGLLSGLLSGVLTRLVYACEDLFLKLPIHWMWWPALGGLVVGIGGYFEPRALGVGYDVIGDLLSNRLATDVVLALIICKAVMWVVALGSGTSGGVLAPLLMMGAALGVLVGPLLPGSQPGLWPLVFMAATLGGMMRAPIMSVMFALELTQDVNALLPLLIASAVAYGFTVMTMPRSILTEKISRRGHHIYREYGIDPLERHIVSEVMSREIVTIDGESSIADALQRHFGADQRHRAFPVIVGARFIGMIDRDALTKGMQHAGVERVADLFGANVPAMALPDENCRIIAMRLAVHGLERLPVVSDPQSRRLVGLIARSDLIKPSLAIGDEEHTSERFFELPLDAARSRFRSLTGSARKDAGEDPSHE
ncbi:MAG TPA: chloride channel protein, partial [Burkholderiaceae bacterium]